MKKVDVDLLEQLVDAMEDAVVKLEGAFQNKDVNYINRLRVFIFDVYQQINKTLADTSSGVSQRSVSPAVSPVMAQISPALPKVSSGGLQMSSGVQQVVEQIPSEAYPSGVREPLTRQEPVTQVPADAVEGSVAGQGAVVGQGALVQQNAAAGGLSPGVSSGGTEASLSGGGQNV